LLRRAEEVFDAFLTADRNLAFQQNISRLRLGVVVLAIGSTKLDDLRPRASDIAAALDAVQPGKCCEFCQGRIDPEKHPREHPHAGAGAGVSYTKCGDRVGAPSSTHVLTRL
jgi:hypothetical protein